MASIDKIYNPFFIILIAISANIGAATLLPLKKEKKIF